MCVCVYVYIYVYIYVMYLVILLAELFTQFYACSIFCKCEPLLTVHAHTDTEGICLYLFVSASQNTPKGKILKFRISLQVKLRLQVTQF